VNFRAQLDEFATDVGRLRRRVEPESSLAHLAERIADRVEVLAAMVGEPAADLYRAYFCVCGDHALALDEDLAAVDRRSQDVRGLLGRKAA
jgi:hypothetical protein